MWKLDAGLSHWWFIDPSLPNKNLFYYHSGKHKGEYGYMSALKHGPHWKRIECTQEDLTLIKKIKLECL